MELGISETEARKALTDAGGKPQSLEKHQTIQMESTMLDYWKASCDNPVNILDDGVCIATDGGISDVDELMYPMQYFYAGLLVAFCIANVYMITIADLRAIFVKADAKTASASHKFLLSKSLFEFAMPVGIHDMLQPDLAIPFVEFLYLAVLVGQIFLCTLRVFLSGWRRVCRECACLDFDRWRSTTYICWTLMPQLSSYSAMRLLYYVTPSVIGTQGYMQYVDFNEHWPYARCWRSRLRIISTLLQFVLTRVFCLVIGLDAFLVKCRMASEFVDRNHCTTGNVLGTFIFLFQVLGVVNLNSFVRERLFIFVFGGEDGNVDPDEKARWYVWNAILAKKIYEHFGLFRGTVVMLGFDDYDFQLIVLDDKEKKAKMKDKIKNRSMNSTQMPEQEGSGEVPSHLGWHAWAADSARSSAVVGRGAGDLPSAERGLVNDASQHLPQVAVKVEDAEPPVLARRGGGAEGGAGEAGGVAGGRAEAAAGALESIPARTQPEMPVHTATAKLPNIGSVPPLCLSGLRPHRAAAAAGEAADAEKIQAMRQCTLQALDVLDRIVIGELQLKTPVQWRAVSELESITRCLAGLGASQRLRPDRFQTDTARATCD